MQPNHLLALIGFTMVALSIGAAAFIEEPTPPGALAIERDYHVSFPISGGSGSGGGTVSDGASGSADVTIDKNNVTAVTVTVERGGFAGPFRQGSVDWTADFQYEFYESSIEEVK